MTGASRRRLTVVAVLGLGLLEACSDDGSSAAGEAVTITDAWARTTPPGATVGAVYLTAASDRDDALVGAAVDSTIAASATLHTTTTDSAGGTSMEALDALDVPADGELVLAPSGNHVMLVDLVNPLEEGDTFELTLTFEAAGHEVVTVDVRADAP